MPSMLSVVLLPPADQHRPNGMRDAHGNIRPLGAEEYDAAPRLERGQVAGAVFTPNLDGFTPSAWEHPIRTPAAQVKEDGAAVPTRIFDWQCEIKADSQPDDPRSQLYVEYARRGEYDRTGAWNQGPV